jgi:sulfur-oxidizing protein SoxY
MNLRRSLLWALGACGLAGTRAWAQHVPQAELLQPYVGQTQPGKGRVQLELPRLADNGYSVPLKLSLAPTPGASDRVRRLLLLSNRNPRPLMAEFEWGPAAVALALQTRVRLNGSQTVYALAQWSDGSWWMDQAEVEVTESACLDQT